MCLVPVRVQRMGLKYEKHTGDQKICALRARLSALTRNEGSTKWKGA